MSKRTYRDYLQDIVDHADKAIRFVQGVSFDDFGDNEEKVFAVVKTLEINGEATRHLPKSMRDQYKAIPWKQVTGMRDRLSHEYFSIDIEVVWRTVHDDLPPLRDTAKKILEDLAQQDAKNDSR